MYLKKLLRGNIEIKRLVYELILDIPELIEFQEDVLAEYCFGDIKPVVLFALKRSFTNALFLLVVMMAISMLFNFDAKRGYGAFVLMGPLEEERQSQVMPYFLGAEMVIFTLSISSMEVFIGSTK